MSADWSKPTLASKEVEVWDELKERDVSAATMFADTNDTNVPVGAIQLSVDAELVGSFNKFNGTSWDSITLGGSSVLAASTDTTGIVELATSAETITGTDDTRAVTPAGLAAKTASATAKGIVELATGAETITGTDTTRVVTPAGLAAKTATTSRAGIVQLSSSLTTNSTSLAATASTVNTLNTSVNNLSTTVSEISSNYISQRTEYVDLGNYGGFNDGGMRFIRVGNMVTAIFYGCSLSSNLSIVNASCVPDWALPVKESPPISEYEISAWGYVSGQYSSTRHFVRMQITETGVVNLKRYNEALDLLASTNWNGNISVSYYTTTSINA